MIQAFGVRVRRGGVGVKITNTSSNVMLKLCSLDIFISKLLINKIENTRNTVSNAHKMIPPAPPCFVW